MSILKKIIKTKKQEISSLTLTDTPVLSASKLSLEGTLKKNNLTLIAEVKQASPSRGIIYSSFHPSELAKKFEQNNAGCISVLTDKTYFKGSIEDLKSVRDSVAIPILRKDFIIHEKQLIEAALNGATVVLLILDILSVNQANELIDAAKKLHLEVLLEIHDITMVDCLPNIQHAPIIGINNRDLHTFQTDIRHTLTVTPLVREIFPNSCIVAESGYNTIQSLQTLRKHRINGVLIGEGLHQNKDLLEWFHNEN